MRAMWICAAMWIGCGGVGVVELGGVQQEISPASGDAVILWNALAERTIVGRAARPGAAAAIDFAIVQGAVRDAVQGVPVGASVEAAVAAAAYDSLLGLYVAPHPVLDAAQREELRSSYAAALAGIAGGEARRAGIAAGEQAAAAALAARADDGRDAPVGYTFGSGPGAWTLPLPGSPAATPQTPWVGEVRPFVLTDARQFNLPPPPALDSEAYVADLEEVRVMGAKEGSGRSAEQTFVAEFWKENAMAQYNRNWRSLARTRGLDAAGAARFFAMTNVASADSLIACLNGKYRYGFWRPVQAVRALGGDPSWLPYLPTPNHPEYPSAHSCLTEAVTETMQAYFGTDKVAWTMDDALGRQRSFARLEDVSNEVMEARIWAGLHYRGSMEAGRHLGRKVAQELTARHFGRVER